ncbi:hypothetical protein C8J57DRAFT_1217673 [Mycena rebaudengoi]|nr:hypothetical protein C8J57DRAFT_1217673 [Mycena rebaudengoi]
MVQTNDTALHILSESNNISLYLLACTPLKKNRSNVRAKFSTVSGSSLAAFSRSSTQKRFLYISLVSSLRAGIKDARRGGVKERLQGLHQVQINLKSVKTKSTKVNSMCLRFEFGMPTRPSTSCEGLKAWREPVIQCRKRVLILGGAISHQILVCARFGGRGYDCRTELGRRWLNPTVQVDFESSRWMLPRSMPDSTADGYNRRTELGWRRLNATAQVDFESGSSMLPRSVPDSMAGGYNRRTKIRWRRLNRTAQFDS